MQTHQLIQNTPEWHQHRAAHFNASDAPAMMGKSKYKTRSQLLHEYATGIIEEVDADTQARFDAGHRAEALARPLAEKIIGEDLYPVVGSEGKHSASFDGLTMAEDIGFEHKSLNDDIRACQDAEELDVMYRIQMEQQFLVSGAEKILFMATKWDASDKLLEEKHFWYLPNLVLRKAIIAGWEQFEADVCAYTPPEVIPAVVAAPTLALPAVSIQVSGAVALTSNLGLFLTELQGFIKKLPEKPSTDQEFVDCKAACKTLQEAQDKLDAAEANAMGQVASFDEMKRAKALCFNLARDTRLALEKLVVLREKAVKDEIVIEGRTKFAEHIASLNTRLGKPYMPLVPTDFPGVIKGKRTITSLRGAVDNELTRAKIEASGIADRIQLNLNHLRECAKDHAFLFSDTATIVLKAHDDFIILVQSRIDTHKAAEAKREEEQRERIRKEEEAKAEAKVKAEQATRDNQTQYEQPNAPATQTAAPQSGVTRDTAIVSPATAAAPRLRPTDIPAYESQAIITGASKLRTLIGEALADMSGGELQQVLDAAREIKAARRERATA